MNDSRREFLLRIARGAVYSVPVVRTLAAPEKVAAQPSGKGMGWMDQVTPSTEAPSTLGPEAPWAPMS